MNLSEYADQALQYNTCNSKMFPVSKMCPFFILLGKGPLTLKPNSEIGFIPIIMDIKQGR